jgi:hypothetical protein
MSRYFVTVHARSQDDLRRVQQYGFDVFAQTAKRSAATTAVGAVGTTRSPPRRTARSSTAAAATAATATGAAAETAAGFAFTVEALLSTDEIEALVKQGLRVTIEDTAEARSHPTGQTLEFTEWLEQMKPTLAKDRAVRR